MLQMTSSVMVSAKNMSFLLLINAYLTVLVFLLSVQSVYAANKHQMKESKILNEIFDPLKYDKKIRPAGINETAPVVVKINTMVRSISQISDDKMEYSIQLTFREEWKDDRLAFKNDALKFLTVEETDLIWLPDLFFKNEKEGHFHTMMRPNNYLRIYPDGNVLYSSRISLTLSCPMNFRTFPHDRQICQFLMASYGWKTDDLIFVWKETDPVQVTKILNLQKFTLEKFDTDYCHSKTATGSYSCLRVDLMFKREFSFYLVQCYIPCTMLVIVSWISFWLDQDAVTARVLLGVFTLLTMSSDVARFNQSLPNVSYTKAIDVWTGVCLTFVFFALLEFAVVHYVLHSDKDQEKKKEQIIHSEVTEGVAHAEPLEEGNFALPMEPLGTKTEGTGSEGKANKIMNFFKTWLSKYPTRSKCVDAFSRIAFPIVFAFFIIIYMISY